MPCDVCEMQLSCSDEQDDTAADTVVRDADFPGDVCKVQLTCSNDDDDDDATVSRNSELPADVCEGDLSLVDMPCDVCELQLSCFDEQDDTAADTVVLEADFPGDVCEVQLSCSNDDDDDNDHVTVSRNSELPADVCEGDLSLVDMPGDVCEMQLSCSDEHVETAADTVVRDADLSNDSINSVQTGNIVIGCDHTYAQPHNMLLYKISDSPHDLDVHTSVDLSCDDQADVVAVNDSRMPTNGFARDADLASDGAMMSGSNEESSDDDQNDRNYVPEVCGFSNCGEDIFLACHICNAFLCYDHMDTMCSEHSNNVPRVESSESSQNSDETEEAPSVGNQTEVRQRKRIRSRPVRRRHQKNVDMWAKNVRKRARQRGQEYVSTAGKIVPAKKVVPCVCHHGRQKVFKCNMFSEETRSDILTAYYDSGDYARQRDFILHNVRKTDKTTGHKKHRSLHFSLPHDGIKQRVCKNMFLRTLNISERLVTYTLDKSLSQDNATGFSRGDERGRHKPHNKTPEHLLDRVRQHIKSFPTMAPHYCRADTNRKFLGAELNITKMYNLYLEQCKAGTEQWVKEGVYRNVFCSEFNLSFHHPRKDACGKCSQFEYATDEEKTKLKDQYEEHIKRKTRAQEEKTADKEKAKANSEWHAATADLQSVLSTTSGNVSSLYYARKLSVYNFTVYDQVTGNGYCMLWDETQGQRGANEIGSLLYMHMKENLDPTVKHVIITSDSTVVQNRNQYVTCMMLFAVHTLPLETIEQKFLEPGHTHMEVDSMHAAIDCCRKNIKIFAPCQWPGVLQMARASQPYNVREVERHEFYDSHKLAKMLNTTLAKSVHWMRVKCIRVSRDSPDSIEVKEDYDEEYRKVPLWTRMAESRQWITRSQRTDDDTTLPRTVPKVIDRCTLTLAYPKPLSV